MSDDSRDLLEGSSDLALLSWQNRRPHAKQSGVKHVRRSPQTPNNAQPAFAPFAEAAAWKAVGPGWRPLFGSYRDLGFSFEWHEFTAREEIDWSRSFHPGSVELCLNLEGRGKLADGRQ